MQGCVIKITRFTAAYPEESPDSYIVGFTIVHECNGRSVYQEARVFYKESIGLDDKQVSKLAWERIAPLCENWKNGIECRESIVGSVFVP